MIRGLNLTTAELWLVSLKIVSNVSRFKPALNLNRVLADLSRDLNSLNSASGCKDIGTRQFDVVAKTKFHSLENNNTMIYNSFKLHLFIFRVGRHEKCLNRYEIKLVHDNTRLLGHFAPPFSIDIFSFSFVILRFLCLFWRNFKNKKCWHVDYLLC